MKFMIKSFYINLFHWKSILNEELEATLILEKYDGNVVSRHFYI